MQITVPVGGSNVVAEGEGPSRNDAPSPLSQRKSLHTVRLAAPTAPEYRPEWKENGQLRWVPQEAAAEEPVAEAPVDDGSRAASYTTEPQPSQQYDTLHREIAELKQTMQLMAQGQLQQPQHPQGPQPPDPAEFDFYDPAQREEVPQP